MPEYKIESLRVGDCVIGPAARPERTDPVAEVCLKDPETGDLSYHGVVDERGIIAFWCSPESLFDRLTRDPLKALESQIELLDPYYTGGYNDYAGFFEDLQSGEFKDDPRGQIWKLLLCAVVADAGDLRELKDLCVGKILGEFDIPVTEAEWDQMEVQDDLRNAQGCMDGCEEMYGCTPDC